jgi:hypothetical protein
MRMVVVCQHVPLHLEDVMITAIVVAVHQFTTFTGLRWHSTIAPLNGQLQILLIC